MNLFNILTARAPNRVFFSILLGAVAGILYALLIPIVVNTFKSDVEGIRYVETEVRTLLGFEVANYPIAVMFFIICILILSIRSISQIILVRVSADVTTDLRVRLYERIAKSSIARLEAVGSAKLIAAIATDINRIVIGTRVLPDVLMHLVALVGMLGYVMFLNVEIFWFVFKAILFGVVTYQIPLFIGKKYFQRSRRGLDALQESIRGLIHGAKELKLDKGKKEGYFRDVLLANEYAVRDADKMGYSITKAALNYGDLITFLVIGTVAFVFVNYQTVSREELIAVVMALLYIATPVSIIINIIPQVIVANVSMNKVKQLFEELAEEKINEALTPIPAWKSLRFSAVTYRYASTDQTDGFCLGPVNMEIDRGSITFIIGGNGSGKSTLSKLITLHYQPTSGVIAFDEYKVDADSLNSCRHMVTAIYSDYYLFDRLLGEAGLGKQALVEQYLEELALDKKVTIENGRFSTTALSDGQRRRLALLVAFLEDKELYLFDEWAADQDPVFKAFFYYHVLPGLKEKGKTVVVISHDERFFDVADRVLLLEDGKLVDDIEPRNLTTAQQIQAVYRPAASRADRAEQYKLKMPL